MSTGGGVLGQDPSQFSLPGVKPRGLGLPKAVAHGSRYGRSRRESAMVGGTIERRGYGGGLLQEAVIAARVSAAGHFRDWERCRRVYGVALDSVVEESRALSPRPFRVLDQCLRDLHGCEHWPAGI
jgi:hypothetical protein